MLGATTAPGSCACTASPLEIELGGRLLLLRNDDAPGMVGRVGTLLGDAGVNIANMTLSRSAAGGDAMMAFALDDDLAGGAPGDARDAPGRAVAPPLLSSRSQLSRCNRPTRCARYSEQQFAALESVACRRPRRSG